MTFDIAVEALAERIPVSWKALPFRRLAELVGSTNATSTATLLSLASTGVLAPRREFDGLGRQAPSDETVERYWITKPGNLVVNPMWLVGGGIGVSELSGAVSPDYRVYRLGPDLHPRYVHHLLRSQPYRDQYKLYTRADTTFDRRVSKVDFHAMPVLVPTLDEQRRIADFLDTETVRIDRLMAVRTKQMRAIQERFDSAWSAAIDDLGQTDGWRPLRRLLTAITDGPFGSALTSDHYSDIGARVIRLGNIGKACFRGDDEAFIPEPHFQDLRRHEVRAGDLIVAGLGDDNHPLGRACVAPGGLGHAIVKADCFRLRLDPRRITHEYAAWALSSPAVAARVSEMGRGSTRARINLSVAREVAIPVPDLSVQGKLVALLAEQRVAVDNASRASTDQCTLLAERRQALITAAVTGQIDVTTAQGLSASGGGVV